MADCVKITKEEFCEFTTCTPDCWIFREVGPNPAFWKQNGEVYFDNDRGVIRRFKRMPAYEEVWISTREYTDYTNVGGKIIWDSGKWSIFTTWCEY